MDNEKREVKTKSKQKTNIRIDNKINNRQVTIIKDKCNDKGGTRKKCPKVREPKEKIRKRFIEIHRCVPIQLTCDETSPPSYIPVFVSATSGSIIKHPSGTITIANTGGEGTMEVAINRITGDHGTVEVGPSSSFTATVSDLKSVEILCMDPSKKSCTGTLELDLFFVVDF